MKQPSPEDAARCMELRCQGKRGIRLHPDDQKFVECMFRNYEDWYAATQQEVFERTRPFGSERS